MSTLGEARLLVRYAWLRNGGGRPVPGRVTGRTAKICLRWWGTRSPTGSVGLRIRPRYQVHGKKLPRRYGEDCFGQAGLSARGIRLDANDGKVLGDRENPVVGFQHNMVHPLERLTSQLRLTELPGVADSGRINHWRAQRFVAACRQ